MASSSSSSFLCAFLSLLCFFFFSFENNSFAFAIRHEGTESSNHDLQHSHHHIVHLSSLFPSSTCTFPPQGENKKGMLEVVHKHGPCSKLKEQKASSSSSSSSSASILHSEILTQDEARVKSIHAKFSSRHTTQEQEQEEKVTRKSKGKGGIDQALLPARSGSILGSGNYFVTVGLGSPKKELSLIFDTGSDLTWTQCEPCARYCYKQKDPTFDPSKSSTYSNISCTSTLCTQLSSATGNEPACSAATNACIYGIQYGDSSFSIGYFGKETLTVSPTDVVDNFLFGCGQNNQGLFGGAAGLLGLGRHPISFVQQTAQKYRKIFSYCLPSTSSSVGYLTFGSGASSGKVQYTPFSSVSQGSSFYGLDVTGISVGGTKLPVSSSLFSAGTIIDSGTVITRLPPGAYGPLRDAFRQAMSKYPKADAVSILDTCYDLSGYKTVVVPKINLSFGGGVNLALDVLGSLYVVSAKQVCLAFAANSDASDVAILGNVQQKTVEVVYDVAAGRIGFGPAGCN